MNMTVIVLASNEVAWIVPTLDQVRAVADSLSARLHALVEIIVVESDDWIASVALAQTHMIVGIRTQPAM